MTRKDEAITALRAIERIRLCKDLVIYITPREEHCIYLMGFDGTITCKNNILYFDNQPFEVVSQHDKKYIKSKQFDTTEESKAAMSRHGL